MDFPKRKATRLSDFDYSSNGAYFVTICTHNRKCVLSDIVGEGLAPPEIKLSKYGQIVEEEIASIDRHFPCIKVEKYVIMPNHIHMLIVMDGSGGASPSPTLSDVVRAFKSITTRRCNTGAKLFQRSFHDHVIRGEQDYLKIWEYIDSNTAKWADDCYYSQS